LRGLDYITDDQVKAYMKPFGHGILIAQVFLRDYLKEFFSSETKD